LKFDAQIDALVAKGWTVTDDFFPKDLCRNLKQIILDDEKSGFFKKAGIGRGDSFQVDSNLRADYIRWLDDYDDNTVIEQASALVENLRININRTLYLGLKEFEGHLTHYPPGTGYAKHIDRFKDSNNRTLSFVTYLNESWSEADGGCLKIYARGSDGRTDNIMPLAARTVIFLSDEIYHEVLPNSRSRYSLTGWFRR